MSHNSFEFLNQDKPILVFGRDGQVGRALQVYLNDLKLPTVFLSRGDCDLSKTLSIQQVLNRYQPQVIINAAAYTAVDKAESEQELAFAINAEAPAVMAHYIASISQGILIHYSTDYVFADTKSSAYQESDAAGPIEQLSIYGQSKLAGEEAIEAEFNALKNSNNMAHPDKFSRYFILRTSWVYGDGINFIRTMLCLAGEQNQLKVVADQIGVPSSAAWLAEVAVQLASLRVASGIYHAVPDGEASWHRVAMFAIEAAATLGGDIQVKLENILPVPATDYPLLAKRPYNSRLNNAKLKQALTQIVSTESYPYWGQQVEAYVKDYVLASLKSKCT